MSAQHPFSEEPGDPEAYTARLDRFYTLTARVYDLLVKSLPIWRRWISRALPHIRGNRVLEISFGTGELLTRYAHLHETYGIEFNGRMIRVARRNIERAGSRAQLQQGDVNWLPFADGALDTVVNTMAFTGYPDGMKAMSEIYRVLKPGGRLVLVDINYPGDGNRMGVLLTKLWADLGGDLVRDMHPIFERFGFSYEDMEIGGRGSVHLYLAEKVR